MGHVPSCFTWLILKAQSGTTDQPALTMALRIKYAFFFTEFWASFKKRCCSREKEDLSDQALLQQREGRLVRSTGTNPPINSTVRSEHIDLFFRHGKRVGVHLYRQNEGCQQLD